MDLRREPAVVFEARRDVGHVEFRFDDRLAAVARLELRQFAGAIAHDLRELEQHAAAILRGCIFPGTLIERAAGGLHGGVDVRGVRVGRLRDDFGRRRIDDVNGRV